DESGMIEVRRLRMERVARVERFGVAEADLFRGMPADAKENDRETDEDPEKAAVVGGSRDFRRGRLGATFFLPLAHSQSSSIDATARDGVSEPSGGRKMVSSSSHAAESAPRASRTRASARESGRSATSRCKSSGNVARPSSTF